MRRLFITTVLVFSMCGVVCFASARQERKAQLLRDGFVFGGADGKLRESDGVWHFVIESDISDGKGVVRAPMGLELLDSACLEEMLADSQGRVDARCRLWGRVTEYDGRNFIFPVYFLPLSKKNEASAAGRKQPGGQRETAISAPNDILNIPADIVARLQSNEFVRPRRPGRREVIEQDSVVTGRTGFIVLKGDGGVVFEPDALGWAVQQVSFRLLPCQVLERAERLAANNAEPVRFRIAGIVSKYKGRDCLLLQKAVRVYSYGNFTR